MAFDCIINSKKNFVDSHRDITLICADVVEALKGLPENSVDLSVTSPPYNVDIQYDGHDDAMPDADYWKWLKSVWENIFRVTKDNGRLCVEGPLTASNDFWIGKCYNTLIEAGWKIMTAITWSKTNITARTAWGSWASPSNPYCNNPEEVVLVCYKGSRQNVANGREPIITPKEFVAYTTGFWMDVHPESATRVGHPAPFPVELPKRCIKLFAYKGDTILDPFNGSGSTGVAAIQCGCKYIGIDISSKYMDISRERIYGALTELKQHITQKEHKNG